jgi:hypothetical protein
MFIHRQRRAHVLETLERRAKEFRTDEDLYPLRVPRGPLPFADVVEQALPDDAGHFDPLTLRSRTLINLEWRDGSTWEAWVLMLPSGLKLFCDVGEEDAHVLASGGRHAGDETDRQFVELLFGSAGERFGIEMSGGAPSRVRCSISDRAFLVDAFTNLFEVTRVEESVRRYLGEGRHRGSGRSNGADFRTDVESWLALALRV